jgi:hypothetical protein
LVRHLVQQHRRFRGIVGCVSMARSLKTKGCPCP